jgi:hypothetical protein
VGGGEGRGGRGKENEREGLVLSSTIHSSTITHSSTVRLLPASAAAMALAPSSPILFSLNLHGRRAIDRWTHRDAWYEPAAPSGRGAEAVRVGSGRERGVGQQAVHRRAVAQHTSV